MSVLAALLRLGWRDLRAHKLRSVLVVMLVAVGSAVLTIPLIVVAQAVTPGANMAIGNVGFGPGVDRSIDPGTLIAFFASATLALVLGALLIAPAFLIGAQRRVRELGVISAVGAGPLGLAGVVLAPAALSGLLGGVVGVFGAASFFVALTPPSRPADAAGVISGSIAAITLGALVALGSAAWPAVRASGASPAAVARGLPTGPGSGSSRTDRTVSRARRNAVLVCVGLGVGGVGLVLTNLGAATQGSCDAGGCDLTPDNLVRDTALLVAGVLLVATGVVAALAGLFGLLDRARFRSVVTSYAARDAARHRLRVIPAIAASATLMAAAGAASIYNTTVIADDLETYVNAAPLGAALLSLPGHLDRTADVAEVAERLTRDPAVSHVVPVRLGTVDNPELYGGLSIGSQPIERRQSALNSAGPLIGDIELVGVLDLGDRAAQAWRAGRVLVADADLVNDGVVTLRTLGATDVVVVPAEVVPELRRYADVVLTEDAASRLGFAAQYRAAIVVGHEALSVADESRLESLAAPASFLVERGSPVQEDLGALTGLLAGAAVAVLLVVWVMTALAAEESRHELGVLEALGAAPRTRRRIAAGQTALVVVPAAALGVPGAIGLTVVFLTVQPSHAALELQVPVLAVAGLLVGVPLVVLLGAWTGGARITRTRAARGR